MIEPHIQPPYPRWMAGLGRESPRASRGFTLVELVVVMAIILILTSLVAPMLSPGRWRADNAVQIVATSLNAAQRLAVLRQHDVAVHFESETGFLKVHRDEDNDGFIVGNEEVRLIELPDNIGFGRASAPDVPDAISNRDLAAEGDDPSVIFHRSGSTNASGVIYLSPRLGRDADDPTSVRAVTIERATGVVRCFSYRSGSWEAVC